MIRINWKGKVRNFSSFDEIVSKFEAEPLSSEQLIFIGRNAKKGNVIFATYSPYAAEINDENVLIFAASAEDLNELFFCLKDEI